MLHIETRGSWREMGRQMGETFRDWFAPTLEHFAPWLVREPETWAPAVATVRAILEQHAPELIEETEGMAEGAGLDGTTMLGLRYFNELRKYGPPGCSGLFIARTDRGPLLARTCDIEPDISAEIQLVRVCRPDGGPDTILVTYLPLTGGVGLNEHGLALAGSSATAVGTPEAEGVPLAVVNHLMMHRCADTAEACETASSFSVRGKGAVEIVCDGSGASALLEFAPGHETILNPRRTSRSWQVCSNFCFSPELVNAAGPAYLENAYARYGRIMHQVAEGFMSRTLAGVKQLFADIAQPGPICHEPHGAFRTAYTFVIELRHRTMHLCPGHPAENDYMEISL